MKKYTKLELEQKSIFVEAKEVMRSIDLSNSSSIILVAQKDIENIVLPTKAYFGEKGIEYNEDVIIEYLDDNSIEYKSFPSGDSFIEPTEGEYIIIYSDEDGVNVLDDPYLWNYEEYFYSYWNGSNIINVSTESVEDVELIETITLGALNYHIFKNESEYLIGFDNEGYYTPVTLIKFFKTYNEAKAYVEREG